MHNERATTKLPCFEKRPSFQGISVGSKAILRRTRLNATCIIVSVRKSYEK